MKKTMVIMMVVALVGSFAISGISSSADNSPLTTVSQDTTGRPTPKKKKDPSKPDSTKTDKHKK